MGILNLTKIEDAEVKLYVDSMTFGKQEINITVITAVFASGNIVAKL